jgi:hypothetical protein
MALQAMTPLQLHTLAGLKKKFKHQLSLLSAHFVTIFQILGKNEIIGLQTTPILLCEKGLGGH